MANAQKPPLEPPAFMTLREGDRPYWDAIIDSRARDEWIDAHLVVAVHLAKCQADIERAQATQDAEGTTIVNARGTAVMNPIVSVLENLSRREMALMRTLRMGGRELGKIETSAPRRRIERDAKLAAAEVEDEELLA